MSFSSIPGLVLVDDSNETIPTYAFQTYQEAQANGSAHPLGFPIPSLRRACVIEQHAMDHRKGRVVAVQALVTGRGRDAYCKKKTIAKTPYSAVWLCVVLRPRRHKFDCGGTQEADWISTDELVAIKVSPRHPGKQKDSYQEAACLQHLGNYHRHILGCLEVLQDDTHLYTVMPYCSGGTLTHYLQQRKLPMGHTASIHSPHEKRARRWFTQILKALLHLQKKGVCMGNLSTDNILVEDDETLILIDFGRALRIPHTDKYGGVVSDVSDCRQRLLIEPHRWHQQPLASSIFQAPELKRHSVAFDGPAVDIWSAGVLLNVLLVGSTRAIRDDFELPEDGFSPEARDLLRQMLWRDPQRRLTVAQVLEHPWVQLPAE